MDLANELNELATLLQTHPASAADRLDMMADQLRLLARGIRAAVAGNAAWTSPGGAMDSVKIKVIGPNRELKHYVDTTEN